MDDKQIVIDGLNAKIKQKTDELDNLIRQKEKLTKSKDELEIEGYKNAAINEYCIWLWNKKSRIAAIKLHRSHFNSSLKEAHWACSKFANDGEQK